MLLLHTEKTNLYEKAKRRNRKSRHDADLAVRKENYEKKKIEEEKKK